MPQPLSLDLRQRIVAAVKAGETKTAVAQRYDVTRKAVAKFVQLEAEGALEPKPNNKRPLRKFTAQAVEAMMGWITEKNDLTLEQIRNRLAKEFNIDVTIKAIWVRLTAGKLTWKKKLPVPPSRNAKT